MAARFWFCAGGIPEPVQKGGELAALGRGELIEDFRRAAVVGCLERPELAQALRGGLDECGPPVGGSGRRRTRPSCSSASATVVAVLGTTPSSVLSSFIRIGPERSARSARNLASDNPAAFICVFACCRMACATAMNRSISSALPGEAWPDRRPRVRAPGAADSVISARGRRSGNSRASKRARPDLASEHAITLRPPWPGHVTGGGRANAVRGASSRRSRHRWRPGRRTDGRWFRWRTAPPRRRRRPHRPGHWRCGRRATSSC